MVGLTLIMKPVGLSCNLGCGYCYNNPERDFRAKFVRISQPTLERVMAELATLDDPLVRFIWHGGEPLLAGIDFYQQVLIAQRVIRDCGSQVDNSIQTNGTLITEKWVDFFRGNGFHPSVSLDGPASVHDVYRVDLGGHGSFNRASRGLKLLQEGRVRFGVVAVVTKASLGHGPEIYNFFRQEGVRHCDFSPCAEIDQETGELLPFSVTPEEYADFIMEIFDLWFKDDDPSFHIRRFREIIQGVIGGCQHLCVFRRVCHKYLAIDYNGDVYLCGRYTGTQEMFLGNLVEVSLKDILSSERYQRMKGLVTAEKEECQECRWKNVCRGGCSYYRYLQSGRIDGPSYLCNAYKAMFDHVEEKVRPLLAVAGG